LYAEYGFVYSYALEKVIELQVAKVVGKRRHDLAGNERTLPHPTPAHSGVL